MTRLRRVEAVAGDVVARSRTEFPDDQVEADEGINWEEPPEVLAKREGFHRMRHAFGDELRAFSKLVVTEMWGV
ncbi:hypothetical protein J7E97_04910 [Streptomyces sp. ISL-66]|uniref:hypothetical protein n=1 Tax=Streptomyces sp. ISL-66 TaxID=2819186 RepID=UPI001BEBDE7B|nr:hypothetical protein [Streptomyces sp. ISL-66]MBT2467227.1 hypothetical protein [Streptomyces sp. ISL-66]